MIVIADSSFLIALATVDALGLLPKIFPMITIPDAVYDEVVKKGRGCRALRKLQTQRGSGKSLSEARTK